MKDLVHPDVLAQAFAEWRESKGYSLAEAAKKVGLPNRIAAWRVENGVAGVVPCTTVALRLGYRGITFADPEDSPKGSPE